MLSRPAVWLVRDLRPRCPEERLDLRAAVRVERAADPVVRREDFRAEVFRAVLRPPRLLAALRLAPVFDRADADERPPLFADALRELFLRPPPPLRPDFDFVLAMNILLQFAPTGARPRNL